MWEKNFLADAEITVLLEAAKAGQLAHPHPVPIHHEDEEVIARHTTHSTCHS